MREGFVDFSKVKLKKVKVEKIYDEEEKHRESAVVRSETKSLAELTNVFEGGFRKKTTKVKRTVLEEGNMNEINEGLKGQNFTKSKTLRSNNKLKLPSAFDNTSQRDEFKRLPTFNGKPIKPRLHKHLPKQEFEQEVKKIFKESDKDKDEIL